jgi:hypothetical protein
MSARRATTAPDLSSELLLMAEDIKSSRAKPVLRRFAQLIDALERAKARYAICGAVAMGAHGAERYTKDIDVLVGANDLERVVRELSSTMVEIGREPPDDAKQVRLRAKRAKGPNAVDVDLLVPVDPLEAWALGRSVRARAFGRKVDVVSPDALVMMKLAAYLSDPHSGRGGQHRADVITLLTTTSVDVPALRRFARGHDDDLAAELERVLAAPPPRGRIR